MTHQQNEEREPACQDKERGRPHPIAHVILIGLARRRLLMSLSCTEMTLPRTTGVADEAEAKTTTGIGAASDAKRSTHRFQRSTSLRLPPKPALRYVRQSVTKRYAAAPMPSGRR